MNSDGTTISPAHRNAANRVAGLVVRQIKAALPRAEDYFVIRAEFVQRLFEAFIGYASSGRPVTSFRNAAGRAILEGASAAFYRGYLNAGGEETDLEDEAWLTARQGTEIGALPGVFAWLKEARDADPPTITEDAVWGRVSAWASSLDSVYAEGQMRGRKNRMMTWMLGATEKHCPTCAALNGQRHSARWFISRNYIPRKPQAAMDCGGWQCDCRLVDDAGLGVTL